MRWLPTQRLRDGRSLADLLRRLIATRSHPCIFERANLTPGQRRSLFTTSGWFDIWSEAFGGSAYRCWSRAGGESTLSVPYMRCRSDWAGPGVFIAYSATNSHTPRYDALGGDCRAEDIESMFRDVRVSCVSFHGVSEHSRLMPAFREFAGRRVQREPFEASPFVDCTLDWRQYWSGRGRNMRANIASVERKLQNDRVEVLSLSKWNDIDPLRETVYEMEASGWKGRRGTAIKQDARAKRFYDRLICTFAKQGLIRLFVLRINGDPVAFELDALYDGVLTGLKAGFVESYAKLSPGQFLRYRFLQCAFADPDVQIYDMLGPASETKARWATGVETLLTLRAFRRSAGGALCSARFVTAPKVKACLRALAHRGADAPIEASRRDSVVRS